MTIGVDDDESAFSRLEDNKGLAESWLRICGRLKGEVGEVEYRTWLTQIALGPIDGDEITLLLPTRFLRDWVRSQYGDRLNELWHNEIPSIRRLNCRWPARVTRLRYPSLKLPLHQQVPPPSPRKITARQAARLPKCAATS